MVLTGVRGVGELTGTAKGGRGGLIHRDVAWRVCSASAVVFLTVQTLGCGCECGNEEGERGARSATTLSRERPRDVGVGASSWKQGAGCGFLCVREGGNGWGTEKEPIGGPHSSMGEREGVRVLACCSNWAKQAESDGKGREMDFLFFIFSNLFSKAFTN